VLARTFCQARTWASAENSDSNGGHVPAVSRSKIFNRFYGVGKSSQTDTSRQFVAPGIQFLRYFAQTPGNGKVWPDRVLPRQGIGVAEEFRGAARPGPARRAQSFWPGLCFKKGKASRGFARSACYVFALSFLTMILSIAP
jgi:hypothetical protein